MNGRNFLNWCGKFNRRNATNLQPTEFYTSGQESGHCTTVGRFEICISQNLSKATKIVRKLRYSDFDIVIYYSINIHSSESVFCGTVSSPDVHRSQKSKNSKHRGKRISTQLTIKSVFRVSNEDVDVLFHSNICDSYFRN